jgi:hypothetical protein
MVLMLIAFVVVVLPGGVAAQGAGQNLTVDLQEFEGSGFSGTATLTDNLNGSIHVSMELRGTELAGGHPTHIHTGTCANFDPNPLYPLETVDLSPVNNEGISESDVEDVTLASLQSGEFVILVHLSPEKLTDYLVCGEIGSSALGAVSTAAGTPGAAHVNHVPAAGAGAGGGSVLSEATLVTAMAALAVVSAVGAGALWLVRRETSN